MGPQTHTLQKMDMYASTQAYIRTRKETEKQTVRQGKSPTLAVGGTTRDKFKTFCSSNGKNQLELVSPKCKPACFFCERTGRLPDNKRKIKKGGLGG